MTKLNFVLYTFPMYIIKSRNGIEIKQEYNFQFKPIRFFFKYFRDEHSLIAQYCQNLHNGDLTAIVPDSPLQIMNDLDSKHRQELELRVRYHLKQIFHLILTESICQSDIFALSRAQESSFCPVRKVFEN